MMKKIYKSPEGKDYSFEKHALNRMAQRRIKRRDIECVLDGPDISYTDREGNLCLVGYLEDQRKLRVVVAKGSDPLNIITVIILD
jgi:hypothetical protein